MSIAKMILGKYALSALVIGVMLGLGTSIGAVATIGLSSAFFDASLLTGFISVLLLNIYLHWTTKSAQARLKKTPRVRPYKDSRSKQFIDLGLVGCAAFEASFFSVIFVYSVISPNLI